MNLFVGRTTIWHGKTDDELRRAVAERIGWRSVEYKNSYHVLSPEDTLDDLKKYREMLSWGLKVVKGIGYSTEDSAWDRSLVVPWFPTSVDAMLKVFKSHGCQWQLWNDYKEYFCQIDIFKGDNQFPIAFTLVAEDTPARAMSVAFLCWLKDEE